MSRRDREALELTISLVIFTVWEIQSWYLFMIRVVKVKSFLDDKC